MLSDNKENCTVILIHTYIAQTQFK